MLLRLFLFLCKSFLFSFQLNHFLLFSLFSIKNFPISFFFSQFFLLSLILKLLFFYFLLFLNLNSLFFLSLLFLFLFLSSLFNSFIILIIRLPLLSIGSKNFNIIFGLWITSEFQTSFFPNFGFLFRRTYFNSLMIVFFVSY